MSPETLTAPAGVFRDRTGAAVVATAVIGTSGTSASGFVPAALPSVAAPGEAEQRARAAGYAAGWASGSRAAAETGALVHEQLVEQARAGEARRDAALTDALLVLERAVQASWQRTAPVVADAQRTLYAAALDLAETILQREVTPGPASARALLQRALASGPELGVHTVRLHPADLAHVRAALADGSASLPDGVEIVGDPTLMPGDAISEHPVGYLDVRILSALDRARAVLLGDDR